MDLNVIFCVMTVIHWTAVTE